jgi:hypothetical protein
LWTEENPFFPSNYFLFILFFCFFFAYFVLYSSLWREEGGSEAEKKLLFKFFFTCSSYGNKKLYINVCRRELITRRYLCFRLSSWDRCLSVERNEVKWGKNEDPWDYNHRKQVKKRKNFSRLCLFSNSIFLCEWKGYTHHINYSIEAQLFSCGIYN